MSDLAIRVENLGKRYRLGSTATAYTTLRETLSEWAGSPLRRRSGKDEEETLWALRGVSFVLRRGEILGLAGISGNGQKELFEAQVQRYIKEDSMSEEVARKSTEKTVALPGTSEHHTGLAFDLTVPDRHFGDTPQAQWLADHCWDHGFILRYTRAKESITGYLPEPWHVRYVGLAEAQFMKKHNLALEEYLKLF